MAAGSGLQIVEVVPGPGGRSLYRLDVAGLERLLLHPDAADRPVAVVSVAGACRRGKSFMLDYFLRHLHADARARGDGSWLGAPHAPLSGFTWRGGPERATTGLLLWSCPLPATLSTGEQGTVLLMDTQGTFDTQTPVRDSSTIFALSTLLSSVQIYNLLRDIGEDDLQHLQMFTAYGRMALQLNNEHRPYQMIKFLIRDWMSDEEIPFGAEGGTALLARRLQTNRGVDELEEVREYIRACFDAVDCFLMPHPGLPVHKQSFDGRHSGLSDDFKQQLVEFVPSVFEARNLPPKRINGARVTGRELFTYFTTYIDLYNSDVLPEPMSIMRATTEATLLTAMEAARRQYAEAMEGSCGMRQRGRPPAAVRALHEAAAAAARDTFRARTTHAPPHALPPRVAQLEQELEERLQDFETLNENKYYRALTDAQESYDGVIRGETGDSPLCLNPPDLPELHRRAAAAALNLFDSRRIAQEGAPDNERAVFITRLDERLRQLTDLNEISNNAAVAEARDDYFSGMASTCGEPPCMRARDLQQRHDDAAERAADIFQSKRNRPTRHPQDAYLSQLRKDIDEKFTKLQNENVTSNNTAVEAAVVVYNNRMGCVCAPHLPSVPQDHLNQRHEDALALALNEFHSKRRPGEDVDETDDFVVRVNQELTRRYQELCEWNDLSAGTAAYCNAMETTCGPGRARLSAHALGSAHEYALNLALQIYQHNRQGRLHGNNSNDDRQRQGLIENIEERYAQYQLVNERNPEAGGDAVRAPAQEGSSVIETALVATGAAMLAGAAVAVVVASGGAAAPAVAGAVGSAVTAETVMAAAATAAGIAATTAAATWNHIRGFLGRS